MGKNKNKRNSIPTPNVSNSAILKKYSFGELSTNLSQIKEHKPVFAFDYLSLNKTKFCFDSNLIAGTKEYQRIFAGLKIISTISYQKLSTDRAFHFHEVNEKDVKFQYSDFLKCIVPDITKVKIDNGPPIYQFKVFEEARVFGFIYNSIFYLVFFDRGHNGYKRK